MSFVNPTSNSFTIRVKTANNPGMVGLITSTIGKKGGYIGAMDIVEVEKKSIIRDYTINTSTIHQNSNILEELKKLDGVEIINVSDRTFLVHMGGKIKIENKRPLNTRDDLSMAYTPGVARVCTDIAKDKNNVYKLTIKQNTIAIVTDGTAVLGLGDIGPEASIPVMEGKCMLFKRFGDINAFPICLNTKDTEEIIETVIRISPIFGGINLEDISSPRCFEIEKRLTEHLDIPVFHDDQHGTAIVVLAGVINALDVVEKKMSDIKVVVCGMGAAGITCSKMLYSAGVKNIVGVDSTGILHKGRIGSMNIAKDEFAMDFNPDNEKGTLKDALRGADVFIGVSAPNLVTVDMIKTMSKNPILFALANPTPEIDPAIAAPHVAIIATGRSDFQNQINNVLCFPGIFKGLLECNAKTITHEMKLAAAYAIASVIDPDNLSADYIIPSVFDKRVAGRVSQAIVENAIKTGIARRTPRKMEVK